MADLGCSATRCWTTCSAPCPGVMTSDATGATGASSGDAGAMSSDTAATAARG